MARLGEFKIHQCCICHKLLDKKPQRLVYQCWNKEKQYFRNVHNYDYCDNCFMIFRKWIRKHRGNEDG